MCFYTFLLFFCPYYSNSYDLTLPETFLIRPFWTCELHFIDTISTTFRLSASFLLQTTLVQGMRTCGARGEAVAIPLSMIIHNSLLDCHSKRISFLSGLEHGGGLPRDCFCFMVEDVGELIPLVRDDVINEKKDEGCILLPFLESGIQPCSRWSPRLRDFSRRAWRGRHEPTLPS